MGYYFHWFYDPKTYEVCERAGSYRIDLERCLTSAQLLDWIYQIRGKVWCSDVVLAEFVDIMYDILNPQGRLCSHGSSNHALSPAEVKKLGTEFQERQVCGVTHRRRFMGMKEYIISEHKGKP